MSIGPETADQYGPADVPPLHLGIVIRMHYSDHAPAHFHARSGEYEARVEIATGNVLSGFVPRQAAAMVREWAALHRAELELNWDRAKAEQPLATIEPLP